MPTTDCIKNRDDLILELQTRLAEKDHEITRLKAKHSTDFLIRSLFHTMSEGFAIHEIILDSEGKPNDYRFLEVNSAFERLTGLKKEAVVGKTVREVIPEIENYWIEAYGKVALDGIPIHTENYSAYLNGWYEVYAYRSAPRQFAVLFSNITARKTAEKALRESEAKFRNLFDNIEEMVTVYEVERDGGGHIVELRLREANPAFLRAVGVSSANEIQGRTSSEVFGNVWSELHLSAVQKAMDTGEVQVQEVYRPDFGRHYITSVVRLDADTYLGTGRDITELKRFQETLARERDLLQSVLNSAGKAHLVYLDRDFNFVRVNETYAATCGYRPEEMIGKNLFALYPQAEVEAIFRQVRDTGHAVEIYDRPFEFADQPERGVTYWDWTLIPVKDAGGQLTGLIWSLFETTARIRAEAALRESEERFRLFMDNSPGIAWIKDEEGRHVYLSRAYERRFGVTLAARRGKTDFELWPPDIAKAFRDNDLAVLRDGQPRQVVEQAHTGDGELSWWLNSKFLFTDAAGCRYVGGAGVDITELKQSEEQLRKNEKIMRADLSAMTILQEIGSLYLKEEALKPILESIVDAAIIISGSDFGSIQLLEDATFDLRIVAQRGFPEWWIEYWDTVSKGEGACGTALARGERVIVEDVEQSQIVIGTEALEKQRKAGVRAVQSTPLMSRSGRLIGMFSTYYRMPHRPSNRILRFLDLLGRQAADIIESSQARQALHQLNDNLEKLVAQRTALADARAKQLQSLAVELIEAEERERQQFAHLLHDDLQQMLAAAKMQLQSAPNFSNDPLLKYVGRILQKSITKTRRLSHELSPAVLHHSGLVAGLRRLAGQMNEQFGLSVLLQADAAPAVENPTLKLFLFRAVQELLFNTIKHAGVEQARVTLSGSDNHMVVSVSDQGHGFEIKEFFEAKKKPGFGLLSITERADYVGGSFKIDTAPGKGSCFTLTVPLDAIDSYNPAKQIPPARNESLSNLSKAESSSRTRVLFADDHQMTRKGLIRLISGQPDIDVVGEASNGREAIEQSSKLKPDVIVMDISMPDMDGIEATRRIKAELPEVRVVGLSMYDNVNITSSMCKAGAESVVNKTSSPAQLLKAIYGVAQEKNFKL